MEGEDVMAISGNFLKKMKIQVQPVTEILNIYFWEPVLFLLIKLKAHFFVSSTSKTSSCSFNIYESPSKSSNKYLLAQSFNTRSRVKILHTMNNALDISYHQILLKIFSFKFLMCPMHVATI